MIKKFSKVILSVLLCWVMPGVLSAQLESPSTTLCWDTSLSMRERDLDKEFAFLESFFSEHQNTTVNLLLFSNTVHAREKFSIKSGGWDLLKQRLEELTYDGGTSFSGLREYAMKGNILIFTDGHQNTAIESPYFEGEVTVVNSQAYYNQANLNLLAILSGGNIANLAEKVTTPDSGKQEYFGKIHGNEMTGKIVRISIKGQERGVKPAADGSYAIEATEGDILVLEEREGNKIEKLLGANPNIDIRLSAADGITLEEVVVTGEKEEPAEESITAYGKKNNDAVGYAVQSISEEEIGDVSTTVNNATQGKFSGMRLGQNDDLSQVILRPSNSILGNNYGLIVIDGIALQQSNSATGRIVDTGFIDPRNIADITVLKGLAATNRFGSMGANGVILIRTKTGTYGEEREQKDLALLNDNIYEGKLKVSSRTLVTPYLKALKKAKNLQEAYDIYLDQRAAYEKAPAFYIDVFQYFNSASQPLALRILTNVLEDNSLKYNTLRAMLFKCQEKNLHELELETAEKLLERFPEMSQSYFDYAMALKHNQRYQESLDELLRMADGSVNPDIDFSGLKKSIDTEIKNLVYQQPGSLDLSDLPVNYRNNLTYKARLVFEWNYQEAEFELQFVNPQNRFFNWEHTSFDNGPRLRQEWEQGFSREEFEIIGQESKGEWLINVKYLGNPEASDQTPLFLRCKVIKDFGRSGQQETVHLVRLHEKDNEEQLVKLVID
ncbi:MAG: TonB-dependent receptor plug domain-containing protein [Flavobacteriaceae bacterium]